MTHCCRFQIRRHCTVLIWQVLSTTVERTEQYSTAHTVQVVAISQQPILLICTGCQSEVQEDRPINRTGAAISRYPAPYSKLLYNTPLHCAMAACIKEPSLLVCDRCSQSVTNSSSQDKAALAGGRVVTGRRHMHGHWALGRGTAWHYCTDTLPVIQQPTPRSLHLPVTSPWGLSCRTSPLQVTGPVTGVW